MNTGKSRRFDPVDIDYTRVWVQLPPSAHLQAMLDAREFVLSALRARLLRLYPDLPPYAIGLKMWEELERAERAYT